MHALRESSRPASSHWAWRAAALGALLCAVLAPAARAQEKLNRGFPLNAAGSVKIFNFAGSIRIVGWDRDSVAITGTFETGGRFFGGGGRDGIKLGVEGPAGGPTPRADLVVRVPATSQVWARGAATRITVEGVIGSVDIGSVGGAVQVDGAPRELIAETMDGALEITGSPAILRAKTATGTLLWRGGGPAAALSSVSGRITTEGGPLGRVRIETVSGEVHILAALRADASVTVESHSGSVELRVPADVPTRVTADVPQVTGGAVKQVKRPEPRVLEFNSPKPGGVAAEVTVRSFKGQLRLLNDR